MRQQTSKNLLAGLVGAVLLGQGAGCSVSCTEACEKLLSCELNDGVLLLDECEDSCQRQEVMYGLWEDDEKIEAFSDHQSCVISSSCGELDDGACYSEELYIFKD